jgi:predicted AAA+ superfamily ATPase
MTTMLDRDVRDLAAIEGLRTLPNLLGLLAARSSGLVNYADLSSSIGVSQPTVKRYVTLLERLFLVRMLPAWSRNLGVRLIKAPKVFVGDTGLGAHVLGADGARVRADPNLAGPLLECFGVLELMKLASWSRLRPTLHHFRTSDGREVDVVLEIASGDLVGVELKASSTVSSEDFRGLRTLDGLAPGQLRCGVVLYTGTEVVPFAANLVAVPYSRLWRAP